MGTVSSGPRPLTADAFPSDASINAANERMLLGRWGDVFFTVWRGEPRSEDLDELDRAVESFERPILGLVGVMEGAPAPDEAARRRMADRSFSPNNFVANALIFRGSGLKASIARSVMTGMQLLTRRPIPSIVTGDSARATEFLRLHAEGLNVPAELNEVFASVLDAK